MKYTGMSMGMWTLFAPSFRKQLTVVIGLQCEHGKSNHEKSKA